MKTRRSLLVTLVPCVCAIVVAACSKSSGSGGTPPGPDGGGDVVESDAGPDVPIVPPQDGATGSCSFNGSDPVSFCLQKIVLQEELSDAYAKGKGVPPSWDVKGTPGSGHSWRDDVSFAASIGAFHCSSAAYGDKTLAPMLDAIMPDLGMLIVQELSTVPSGYDGEDYFRLRAAATGLAAANDATDAPALAQIADAFGRKLQTSYAQTVTLPEGGTATLLGTPDGMGNVTYAPAQVIMAAAALVDMANVHASDPDAGADVPAWVQTALAAVDYVWSRGRDPSTGLFFQQLVTSTDPGHDALGQGMPAPDALLTDVQAEAVLGLARLQDAVNALAASDPDAGIDASAIATSAYWNDANTILQGLVMAGLWDGDLAMGEAGIPNPAPVGAFMEAYVPSTMATGTNKTTLGNAWILGAAHRLRIAATSQLTDSVEPQLVAALTKQTPANSSLFTVLTDMQTGNPVQTDYLRASSKDFHYATVFSADGGAGGQEPGAASYRADAVAAVIEGLTQLWHGVPNAPPCAQ